MSIEGLFFDFDGVIADTETCWVQTIVSYCAARGIALDRRTLYSYLGDGDVQMLRYLGMCCGAASETLLAELHTFVIRKNNAEGEALDADEMRQVVRDNLAEHSVPEHIHFVDDLPRNATGKVVPRLLPVPDQD